MQDIRLLLADDHAGYLASLERWVGAESGIVVVGRAADGVAAVDAARRLQPDVILMDLQMPRMSGVEATRLITDELPGTAVVMLTFFEDDDSVFEALRCGARGYLLKEASRSEIVRAIRGAHEREAIFGPVLADRILRFFRPVPRLRGDAVFPELTEREHQVLALMVKNLTNPEIAEQLQVSEKTIRNVVSSILGKLHVERRSDAIRKARGAGLGW